MEERVVGLQERSAAAAERSAAAAERSAAAAERQADALAAILTEVCRSAGDIRALGQTLADIVVCHVIICGAVAV